MFVLVWWTHSWRLSEQFEHILYKQMVEWNWYENNSNTWQGADSLQSRRSGEGMTLNTVSVDEQLRKADRLWVSGWASTASLLTTESRQSVFICLCARFMRFLTRMNEGMNSTFSAYCIRNSCYYIIVKKIIVTCLGMQDVQYMSRTPC
jgi:hypothetical protein